MRGTPMVGILYVAMLILPMALPESFSMDKMLRAMVMVTLFWAAYIAEVIRAGLQAIPTRAGGSGNRARPRLLAGATN